MDAAALAAQPLALPEADVQRTAKISNVSFRILIHTRQS